MRNGNEKKAFAALLFAGATLALFSLGLSRRAPATPTGGDVQRGKYLVEQVAMCGECHTPRDAQGILRKDAWMQGAPIWISPVRPIQNWADHAPALAGLTSFTEPEVVAVLEKGTGPQGEILRPPMHIYHMNHTDAQAIAVYLKSLRPEVH